MKNSLSLLKDIKKMADKSETIEVFREMLGVVIACLEIIGKDDFQKEG